MLNKKVYKIKILEQKQEILQLRKIVNLQHNIINNSNEIITKQQHQVVQLRKIIKLQCVFLNCILDKLKNINLDK